MSHRDTIRFFPAFFRRYMADPRQRMLLYFGLEGILLQFITSVNSFGNNLYATNMGATDTQIGLIQMVPNLAAVALLLPAGVAGGRLRSSKTLPVILLCFMGIMYFFYGTVPIMGQYRMGFFYVFLGMTAGVLAIYNAQWQTFFGDVTYPGERNTIYTFRNRFMFVIGTITPLFCGIAMSAMGDAEGKLFVLRIFYYLSGGFVFLQAFILSRIPEEKKEQAEEEKKEKLSPRALLGAVREAAAYKPFRSFFILILFFYLSWHLDWTMWYLGEVQYMKMTEAHLSIFNAACCVVQLFAIGFFARLNNRKSVDFTMPLAVGSMCVSCLAIITGAMVPEGIRPWWFIVVATLATIPQSSLQLCIVQMLLDAVPPKNRSLIISIYTMVITLSNSILPLLGVELYQALGGDMRALVLFYSIAFVWRALSAGLFWMRYRHRRKEENAGFSGEKEGETEEKSSV